MRAVRSGHSRARAASTCRSSASAPTGTSASTSRRRDCSSDSHPARLEPGTRRSNADLFDGRRAARCRPNALSMGVGTILRSRADRPGRDRQRARRTRSRRRSQGLVTTRVPASLLQLHGDVEVVLDAAASACEAADDGHGQSAGSRPQVPASSRRWASMSSPSASRSCPLALRTRVTAFRAAARSSASRRRPSRSTSPSGAARRRRRSRGR